MEPSGQVHEESRDNSAQEQFRKTELHTNTESPGVPARGIHSDVQYAENDQLPNEPTQADIENGVNEAVSYLNEFTGREIIMEGMEPSTQHILYEINRQRKQWSKAMESDAGAALQSLYPDVSGSGKNGPL